MKLSKIIFFLLVPIFSFGQFVNNPTFHQRKLIFEGNSLSNYDATSTVEYQYYVPKTTYIGLLANNVAFQSFAIAARTTTQIVASEATNILPYVYRGDIIILWEGSNDLYVNSLTAAQAFANIKTYIQALPTGVKVIVGTVIARDYSLDPADLMNTRIPAFNTLVRDSAATYKYTVADFAANSIFDARADCSNATYYKADKIHLIQAGYDVIISIMNTAILLIL